MESIVNFYFYTILLSHLPSSSRKEIFKKFHIPNFPPSRREFRYPFKFMPDTIQTYINTRNPDQAVIYTGVKWLIHLIRRA